MNHPKSEHYESWWKGLRTPTRYFIDPDKPIGWTLLLFAWFFTVGCAVGSAL